MTSNQKFVLVLGLLGIGATCLAAPYRWTGERMGPTETGGMGVTGSAQGVAHAPLWSAPTADEIERASGEASPSADLLGRVVIDLDAAKLGLWWAGIAIVTTVAILLIGGASARPAEASP